MEPKDIIEAALKEQNDLFRIVGSEAVAASRVMRALERANLVVVGRRFLMDHLPK